MKGNDNLKKYLKRTEGISSRRVLMTALMALAVLVIGAVLVAGVCLKEQALTTDFTRKNIAPCIQYAPAAYSFCMFQMLLQIIITFHPRSDVCARNLSFTYFFGCSSAFWGL